ncbi:EF-hand domain-containing protein [Pendulispora brunnea]|uniref:EF-hand domain-containing protein n=1 Tax=Pendulispora brunnea TaxID=2905690 RepID=A0ABZ2JYP5_9BACT
MQNQLLKNKLNRAFKHLDVDGNGYAEHEDLLKLAARLMAGFHIDPASSKGQKLLNTSERYWQAMVAAADLDGDRRLSPEEFRAGMTGAFVETDGGFERNFRPLVQAAMDIADTDGDGVLSFPEFEIFQHAVHTPDDLIPQAFKHLDRDKSGTLTVDELVEAARDFYTSTDESATGNWMYGPL